MPTPHYDKVFFERFLNNKCTYIEEKRFLEWLEELDDEVEVNWLKDEWDFLSEESHQVLGAESKIFKGVLAAIRKSEPKSNLQSSAVYIPKRRIWDVYPVLRYASIIFLVLVPIMTLSLFISDTEDHSVSMDTKTTHNGQHLTITLEDGSRITLNSNTKLLYPLHFNDSSRVVELEGEAFFQVEKDARRPFVVRTKDFETVVLGTTFNIRAKNDENTSFVALVSGALKVKTENSSQDNTQTFLNPGEQLTYLSSIQEKRITKFDIDLVTGWKDGRIVFKNASFNEVKSTLEEWFDAKIVVDSRRNSLFKSDWSYTGTFENKSLDYVLKGIAYVKGFKYQFLDDKNVEIN